MGWLMRARTESTATALAAMHEDGYVLLRGIVGPDGIAELRNAIDGLEPVHWDYEGLVDHYKCVFNRSPLWLPYLDLPGVIELAEAAMGADCHVIGQTAWRCHPGFIGADLHLDYLPMRLPPVLLADPAFELPMFVCTAQIYLDDIDELLCPTLVIPGSHRAGRPPREGEGDWQGREPRSVLCRAGDVLFLRSELWHAGSRNRATDRSRYLLQVHYGRRMVAQKFSPYLEWRFNPEVLAACTPRQRRLLGDHEAAEYD
ncbi:Phytanoyl-CoA dioxygenase (PhyH) [compost metagenome]